ncbi:MAG: glutamine synthetase family protein [Ruminococcus sp.]
MKYSKEEVMQYVYEEDVKFIRLAFCDVFGKQKNIAIMPSELSRAFEYGIAFDASAITGFGDETHSDLLLHPEPETLMLLPWRPEHGKVVRMFTYITYPDGTPFECDTRNILRQAIECAAREGYMFDFGAEQEFYLFLLDENGKPTKKTYDEAGYMDVAPNDRGENIRREICLTLEQMGIKPESSQHKEGPGQNEIDYHYSDPLSAADNTMTFQTVVQAVADRNGLYVDFSPKPLQGQPGNGFHVNVSVFPDNNIENLHHMIAGVLSRACEMTAFLNPTEKSYARFGENKAPAYVSWSRENRSQLVRIPASPASGKRAELRSPDPTANPYITFALVIYAALEGLKNKTELMPAADVNLYNADEETIKQFAKLPRTLKDACALAASSDFIKAHIPNKVLQIYCNQ